MLQPVQCEADGSPGSPSATTPAPRESPEQAAGSSPGSEDAAAPIYRDRYQEVRGGTTEVNAGPLRMTGTDRSTREAFGAVTRQEAGTVVDTLDGRAMARELRSHIETLRQEAGYFDDAERERCTALLAELDAQGPNVSGEFVLAMARRDGVGAPLDPDDYRVVAESSTLTERQRTPTNIGTTTTMARQQPTDGGGSSRQVRTTATRTNVADGSRSTSRTDARTETAADGSRATDTETGSTTVTINEGVRVRRERSDTHQEVDATGETTRDSGVTVGVGGGLTADDDGNLGATTSFDADLTEQVGNVERTAALSGSTRVTGEGAEVSGEGSLGVAQDGVSLGVKVSPSGRLRVVVSEVPHSDPKAYRLEVSLRLGVSGQLTGGAADAANLNSGSANINAGASGTLAYSHTLSAAETVRYLAQMAVADSGREPSMRMTELSLLANAGRAQGQAGSMADAARAAVANPDAARSMAVGDQISLTTEVTGGAGVSGTAGSGADAAQGTGALSLGGGASATARWRRELTVTPKNTAAGPRTDIKIEFVDTYGTNRHANGGAGGATAQLDEESEGSTGSGLTLRLDPAAPNFDAIYREIANVATREQLLRLRGRRDILALTTSSRDSGAAEEGLTTTIGAAGASLAVGETAASSQSREIGPEGLSGEAEGSLATSTTLAVGDTTLLSNTDTSTTRGRANHDGSARIQIERSEADNDPLRTAREGAAAIAERSIVENGAHAVSRSPLAHLRAVMAQQFAHVQGVQLDEPDLEKLRVRAANSRNWGRARALHADTDWIEAWDGLAHQLRHPDTEPDEMQINADVAKNLACIRHLARFTSQWGHHAHTSLINVLRRWGQAGARGEELGERYEWPASLSDQRADYESLTENVRTLRQKLRGFGADAAGFGQATRYIVRLGTQTEELRVAVRQHSDAFDSTAALEEMTAHLDQQRLGIQREHQRYLAWQRRHAGEADVDEAGQQEAEPEVADTAGIQRDERTQLARQMAQHKRSEHSVFQRVRALGGNLSSSQIVELSHIYQELRSSYRHWITKIERLRGLYQEANVAVSDWKVSWRHRVGDRSPDYEPEIRTAIQVYQGAGGSANDTVVADLWRISGSF